ncbi:MAG: transposase [Deltaproteobacteria bacterium]|jgi:transposase|nr:transposase [Deltaproteobacteria bacterium]
MPKNPEESVDVQPRLLVVSQGVESLNYIGVKRVGEGFEMDCEVKAEAAVCPSCGSKDVSVKENVRRVFRGAPLNRSQVEVVCQIPIVKCHSCRKTREVDIDFADKKKKYTKAFYSYFIKALDSTSITVFNKVFGVPLDICYLAFTDYLHQEYVSNKISNVKEIIIDDILINNGDIGFTIVMDLETKRVLSVGQGHAPDALDEFWALLGPREAKKIKAVALDPNASYVSSVASNLRNASIIFDRFHVEKLMDQRAGLEKKYIFSSSSADQKYLIEADEFATMEYNAFMDPQDRLDLLREITEPLTLAFILHEDLARIWRRQTRETATNFLTSWIEKFIDYDNPIVKQMTECIDKYSEEILNWFDNKVNVKPLQDFYKKVAEIDLTIDKYRDIDYYKLVFLGLHDPKIIRAIDQPPLWW